MAPGLPAESIRRLAAFMGERINETVLCPRCGFECVHPTGVVVNAGGQVTCITSDGTSMLAASASGRGVRIALEFWCENQHGFEWVLQFHKGITSMDIKPSDQSDCRTIWRD
jgi:hypothetical protein